MLVFETLTQQTFTIHGSQSKYKDYYRIKQTHELWDYLYLSLLLGQQQQHFTRMFPIHSP